MKSIATFALTFYVYIISVLASVSYKALREIIRLIGYLSLSWSCSWINSWVNKLIENCTKKELSFPKSGQLVFFSGLWTFSANLALCAAKKTSFWRGYLSMGVDPPLRDNFYGSNGIYYYQSTLHSLLYMDVILLSIHLWRFPPFWERHAFCTAHFLLGQYILVMVYFKGQRKEEITQKKRQLNSA